MLDLLLFIRIKATWTQRTTYLVYVSSQTKYY